VGQGGREESLAVELAGSDLSTTLPMPDLEEDDDWEVEEIRDDLIFEDELHYLVEWTGWPFDKLMQFVLEYKIVANFFLPT
jgi:hypothetical protein